MEPNPPKVDEKLAREVHVIATQPATNDGQYQRLTLAMLVAAASLAGVVLGFCLGFGLNSQTCRTDTHHVAPSQMATTTRMQTKLMPLLGVVFSQTDRPGGEPGATISSVIPGTAAAKIGLRSGDVIQRVGEIDVVRSLDLLGAVRNHSAGDITTVRYCRAERCATEAVILGKFHGDRVRGTRQARYR